MPDLMRASIAALLSVACSAWAIAADAPPDRLAALEDNRWLRVEPRPSKRLVLKERHEHSAVSEITSREPAFREYTSPAWGDGKIYYFGGGHSGYPGNDVEIYDPAENIWRQCYRPVCPPKDDSTYYSGGSERCYVDPDSGAGQPYVLHGYARTGFDPKLRRYVCTAMFPTEVKRDTTTGKWKLVSQAFSYIGFDEKTNRWERLASLPDALKPGPTSLSYDPDLGGMVAFSERAGYVLRDSEWRLIGESKTTLVSSGGTAAIHLPGRATHLLAVLGHGGAKETGALAMFNVAEKKGSAGPDLPAELKRRIAPGTGGFNLVMAYDSTHKKLVFMAANDELRPEIWTYDPGSGAWEHLGVAAGAPKLMGVFEPGRGRAPLIYDPARNVFFAILRNGDEAETWAYRYRQAKTK